MKVLEGIVTTEQIMKLDGSLLRRNPFERPTQISTDFENTSALAWAVQKIDMGEFI